MAKIQWKLLSVLYFDEKEAVVVSADAPPASSLRLTRMDGSHEKVLVKAVNAAARKAVADQSQAKAKAAAVPPGDGN
eukprot:373837-Amphidinium_carterae.1